MNMELLGLFILLNIVNVIIQTVKSLATIKGGKWTAALVNAGAYGLYTIVLVYTMCDLPLMWKALVVALCNLVGVFIVKLIEEKSTRDKLWKIEVTVRNSAVEELHSKMAEVSHHYVPVGKNTKFEFYCETQAESKMVKDIVKEYGAKYFVVESKIL